MERVETKIAGFDSMIGGGIPRPSLILLSGQQGTGKSTFGLQFLMNGTMQKEKGLYVSFIETEQILSRNMSESYDFDLNEPKAARLLTLKKYNMFNWTSIFRGGFNELKNEIRKKAAKRVVIDPFNIMINEIRPMDPQNKEYNQMKRVYDICEELGKVQGSMQMKFRAVYAAYQTNPCAEGADEYLKKIFRKNLGI